MPDYANSTIYTIKFNNGDNSIYIGSTTRKLNCRFTQHKNSCDTMLGKYIKEKYNDDWSFVFIDEYEKYPCSCVEELHKREGEVIKIFRDNQEYNCLNKLIAGNGKKETYRQYYYKNKEIINEKHRKYRDENKEKEKARSLKYREENREKIKERNKIYYERNKLKSLNNVEQ